MTWDDHLKTVFIRFLGVLVLFVEVQRLYLYICNRVIALYSCALLFYCNVRWANDNLSCLEKLLVCQRKALRVVLKLKWNAHTHIIMRNMNILNIVDINIFQIGCYMYKAMSNLLPSHLSNYFVKTINFTTTILGRVTICMSFNHCLLDNRRIRFRLSF